MVRPGKEGLGAGCGHGFGEAWRGFARKLAVLGLLRGVIHGLRDGKRRVYVCRDH